MQQSSNEDLITESENTFVHEANIVKTFVKKGLGNFFQVDTDFLRSTYFGEIPIFADPWMSDEKSTDYSESEDLYLPLEKKSIEKSIPLYNISHFMSDSGSYSSESKYIKLKDRDSKDNK